MHKAVEDKLIKFTQELHGKLKNNVYDSDDIKMINKVRFLTDLKGILVKVKARGVAIVSALEGDKFVEHAKSLLHTIQDVPDEVLKMQHNKFLKTILNEYDNMSQAELENLTSMDIIKKLMGSNLKLYEGIELIMHTISAASVAISVESIVESVVSIYENRQNKSRTIGEDRANLEMQIGFNGPNLSKADIILEKAMDAYFKSHKKGKWHFTMDPCRLDYTVSKLIDTKINSTSKLSFMDI